MAIYGTALLALCTLLGAALGEVLGVALHVKANVGGVGIAMLLLIAAKAWLARQGRLTPGLRLGVEFWAVMYIPIVVAMAAQQNVLAAVEGEEGRGLKPSLDRSDTPRHSRGLRRRRRL